METTMNNRLLKLVNGDLLELADARGTTLHVKRGTLWVTQQRDRRDVVLGPGDVWTVERYGLTVAEARSDAAVVVIGNGLADASVRSRQVRWRERLAQWLARIGDRHLRRSWVPHL
jgi:Protein of unknown function (DUF2917)